MHVISLPAAQAPIWALVRGADATGARAALKWSPVGCGISVGSGGPVLLEAQARPKHDAGMTFG